jgi:hypothetical protein
MRRRPGDYYLKDGEPDRSLLLHGQFAPVCAELIVQQPGGCAEREGATPPRLGRGRYSPRSGAKCPSYQAFQEAGATGLEPRDLRRDTPFQRAGAALQPDGSRGPPSAFDAQF